MTSLPSFGKRKVKKLCRKLNFVIDESKGKGGHAKATHPTRIAKDARGRTTKFIIIPGRKEYSKSFREKFIKELTNFGFTKEEIIKKL
jgi:hypothetical protein